MTMAWERVKANKGASGVDNMPIDDSLAFAREHWEKIRSNIARYSPTVLALSFIALLLHAIANHKEVNEGNKQEPQANNNAHGIGIHPRGGE
jgi:hypothetical protein